MAQRRQGFRPRPLDPYKQLLVYNDAADFDQIAEDEAEAIAPVSAAQATADAPPKKSVKRRKATAAAAPARPVTPPVVVPGTLTEQLKVDSSGKAEVKKFNLPVPETAKASAFDQFVPKTFKAPNAYIRHRLRHIDDYSLTGQVEYELSHEDELWLRDHKLYGPNGKYPLMENELEQMIDLMERKTAREFPIPQGEVASLCRTFLPNINIPRESKVVEDVYSWWIQRRQKLRKPLLRRFWPITASNDSSPNLTFRPREKERYRLRKKRQNDLESYEKLGQLKNDFEMMKCLLELVRRREELHEINAQLFEDEFEQEIYEIVKGPLAATQPRQSIAPVDVSVGPLPSSVVDPIFEPVVPVARTPQNVTQTYSSRTSTPPGSLARTVSESVNSVVDVASIESDALEKKKRKKKKRKDEILVPETVVVASPLEVRKKKKKAESQKHEPPPLFLRTMEPAAQYVYSAVEIVTYPNAPSWPNSNLQDYRRTSLQQQQNQRVTGKFLCPPTYEQQQRKMFHHSFAPPQCPPHVDHKLKYRCRGRIGRGGRIIVDRIPVLNSEKGSMGLTARCRGVTEVRAGPDPLRCGQDFLDPAKCKEEVLKESSGRMSITVNKRSRIESIYNEPDSEEEDVEIINYPYLSPYKLGAEEAARLESIVNKAKGGQKPIRETKFRFIL